MSDKPLQSFLDRGAAFEGKISFDGVVRIDGHFCGDAHAEGTLVVGESGVVEATLSVGSVIVHGTVSGDIVARDRVEISATGSLSGTVRTRHLVVEDGARVSAKIEMGTSVSPPAEAGVQPDVAPARGDLKSRAALP